MIDSYRRRQSATLNTDNCHHAVLVSQEHRCTSTLLQARCPSCHPTNSFKALKACYINTVHD